MMRLLLDRRVSIRITLGSHLHQREIEENMDTSWLPVTHSLKEIAPMPYGYLQVMAPRPEYERGD